MSIDMKTKLEQVLDLAIEQTRSGRLTWKQGFNSSYQATLGGLTLVTYRDAAGIRPAAPVMEFRDFEGEILQVIKEVAPLEAYLQPTIDPDPNLVGKVETLLGVISQGKQAKLNAALDSLLKQSPRH